MSDAIEVNSGNLVYKLFIPSNYLSADATEDEKKVADHYLSLLKQIASGERNAVVFPSDRDEQGNLYFDLQVVGVTGTEEAAQQMDSLPKNNEEGYVYYVMLKGELHRGPWGEAEVDQWLDEVKEEGFPTGTFYKARQKVGEIEVL